MFGESAVERFELFEVSEEGREVEWFQDEGSGGRFHVESFASLCLYFHLNPFFVLLKVVLIR